MPDPAPKTRRINRGRGHSYELRGERVDGVTTILSKGVPKPALIGWAFETASEYAVDNWNELSELGAGSRLTKIQKARYEKRDAAANRGTQVHALAQQLASGEEVDVPEELTGHVDAYLQFTRDWQPEEVLVEAIVANVACRYMGTLDLVAKLADGQTWLIDWKTGGKGIFREAALQLAAYRNAEFFVDDHGDEQPMPAVDRAGCVWLRADGYDLIPVDTSPNTFRIFRYVQQVAMFMDESPERYILDALQLGKATA